MTHSLPYTQYLVVEAAVEDGDIPKARKIIAKSLPKDQVEELLDKIRAAYAPDAAWRNPKPKPKRARKAKATEDAE